MKDYIHWFVLPFFVNEDNRIVRVIYAVICTRGRRGVSVETCQSSGAPWGVGGGVVWHIRGYVGEGWKKLQI